MRNIFNKLKDRYTILIIIIVLLFFILSLRLAILTIAQGDHYRDLADNLRLREVKTSAPRGEIKDRNGKLLATNIPNFTVQLYKDELDNYDKNNAKEKNIKKNKAFLTLGRLLEEDGVDYEDELPLDFNVYTYNDIKDYKNEKLNPLDKVVDIIVENDLMKDILNTFYLNEKYPEHFEYILANRVLNIYKKKGMNVPIKFKINKNNALEAKFIEKENINSWKNKNKIDKNADPISSLVQLIDNDKTVIKSMLDHSLARKLTYEILKSKNLTSNVNMEDIHIVHEDEYIAQKIVLNEKYPQITLKTKAIDDFALMFQDLSLEKFLSRSFYEENDKKFIVPGEILIGLIEDKGIDIPIKVKKDRRKNTFEYIHKENKNMKQDQIIKILANYSNKFNVLKDFLSHEDIKAYAQNQLLSDGINPKISISSDTIEYSSLNELKQFYNQHKIDYKKYTHILEVPKDTVYNKLVEFYNLDKKLSRYEIRSILNIYDQIKRQGYLAYQPINIAYGIKDETVAKIEESLVDVPGIEISIEPVRYYPEGKTAAHILGYLGKISQPEEIKEYVDNKGYSKNAIIGKTGIEESMEEHLNGKSGIEKVEVDSLGNTIKVIESETVKPIPGNSVYLSIDLKLQKVAEKALEQNLRELRKGGTFQSKWGNFTFGQAYTNATSGAVVAIDVKTGQVLASASYPSYDPNLFSTGISSTDWSSLFPENEDDMLAPRPLYNIVTQTAVQPGSIYKMLPAITALEKGLSPDKGIRDMGFVEIGDKRFECLVWTLGRSTHGYVNVYEALRDSCNYYFYTLALGSNQKTGESLGMSIDIDDIIDMSEKFGLGEKTGIEINVPAESKGGVPNPDKKLAVTQGMLRGYLNSNIDKFFKKNINSKKREEIIDEILSWLEEDEIKSRNEVAEALEKLGIDSEKVVGRESLTDTIKYSYLNQAKWNITDTLNVTIGQGLNAYTPIQMANFVATLSNGGYRHDLTLLDSIKTYDNKKNVYMHKANPSKIELNNYNNLEYIKKGMNLVATSGTASKAFANFPIDVGVKTGTAENKAINPVTNREYDNFAWFVGFAPYNDPEIAVATVLFQGGSGAYAAPVVREVIAEYMDLNKKVSE